MTSQLAARRRWREPRPTGNHGKQEGRYVNDVGHIDLDGGWCAPSRGVTAKLDLGAHDPKVHVGIMLQTNVQIVQAALPGHRQGRRRGMWIADCPCSTNELVGKLVLHVCDQQGESEQLG